jgi:hypothetical protein
VSNSLRADLTGKVVVLKAENFKPAYQDVRSRLFRVDGGFGASSFTRGTALIGEFLADGEKTRMDGHDIERLATDEEIAAVTP